VGLRGGEPARDARGFDVGASDHTPGEPDDELGLAKRHPHQRRSALYVDHAHPEYSAPEVTDRATRLWDKAGERIMAGAAERGRERARNAPILLYKNNTDNKGASYGTHENYLWRARRRSPTSSAT
jgi:proteasome accessory factor A